MSDRQVSPAAPPEPVWHVVSSDDLLSMLRRVAKGADPEFVYLEEYANADHEAVDGN